MSEWISKNPGAFITIVILAIGNIWSLAVAMEQARQTRLQSEQNKKAVDDLREDFDDHLRKDGVHRSADSEARISRIDSGINAIGSILTDIQTQLARLGAGRQRS